MPTVAYSALYSLAEDQLGYLARTRAGAIDLTPMALVVASWRDPLAATPRAVGVEETDVESAKLGRGLHDFLAAVEAA